MSVYTSILRGREIYFIIFIDTKTKSDEDTRTLTQHAFFHGGGMSYIVYLSLIYNIKKRKRDYH